MSAPCSLRLPRPGLAGRKSQTRREFDTDMVDQFVIFESKFGRHRKS